MTKQKHKDIEPIETDSSIKYLCPNCSNAHWISLREAKIKNFKIVCECNTVIVPKRIKKLKTVFHKTKIKPQQIKQKSPVVIPPVPKSNLSYEIQQKCIDSLKTFGYTEEEIKRTLPEAIEASRIHHIKLVIDYLLKNLGEKND